MIGWAMGGFYIVARCGWVWLSNISFMGFDKNKEKNRGEGFVETINIHRA